MCNFITHDLLKLIHQLCYYTLMSDIILEVVFLINWSLPVYTQSSVIDWLIIWLIIWLMNWLMNWLINWLNSCVYNVGLKLISRLINDCVNIHFSCIVKDIQVQLVNTFVAWLSWTMHNQSFDKFRYLLNFTSTLFINQLISCLCAPYICI